MVTKYQATQAGLATAIQPPVETAWNLVDTENLQESLPAFIQALLALVTKYGRMSSQLATRAYLADRTAADVRGHFTVKPADPPPFEQVDKSLRWATSPLYGAEPDVETSKTNVKGVVDNLVIGTGRITTIDAVKADRKARGWAREVEPGACSFCLLLATRGAVYRNAAGFQSHNHCRCVAVPVFGEFEPTAEVRRAQALYRQAKQSGGGPKAVRNNFRQLIEAPQ